MPRGVSRYDEARLQGRLWTPAQLGSRCFAWYDPTHAPTLIDSGGNIVTWAPRYGVGPTLTATGSVATPTVDLTSFNGRRSALLGRGKFVGIATGAGMTGSAAFSFFMALKTGANGAPQTFGVVGRTLSVSTASGNDYDSPSGTSCGTKNTDGFIEYYRNNGEVFITGNKHVTTTGETVMLDLVQDGTNGTMYQDGTLYGSMASTSTFAGDRFSLATYNFPNAAEYCGDTYFGDVTAVKGVLSRNEIARIQGHNAWKWGLVKDLPASHAYKNRPPLIGA